VCKLETVVVSYPEMSVKWEKNI